MSDRIRVAFCLPGLHRVARGAEIAFESLGAALARRANFDVTLFGSGSPRPGDPYRFIGAGCVPRERFESWPKFPLLRTDGHWEELTFLPGFLRRFKPNDFDAVITCSYPLQSWAVRARRVARRRPLHVFVTQNGDWPLHRKNSEYLLFDCDALVCTNPDYFETHGASWPSKLIPNGVDCSRFTPGRGARERYELDQAARVVLIVSALVPSKRVLEGMRAVAAVPGATLVVAGDGPLRDELANEGRARLGNRFHNVRVAREDMPELYRSADALLHMSVDEPFGNVYIEALASGLPIVAHDRRVTRWMLGDHALLVDTNDAAAVTAAVTKALAPASPSDARVAEARRRFDWSIVAAEYADFIAEALGPANPQKNGAASSRSHETPRPGEARAGRFDRIS